MVAISTRVDGTLKLRRNLSALTRRLPTALVVPGAVALAEEGVRYAKANKGFNNRTGDAEGSIMVEQSRDAGSGSYGAVAQASGHATAVAGLAGSTGSGRFETGVAVVAGGPDAPHFRFLEFGTIYIAARRTIGRTYDHLRRVGGRIMSSTARRNFPGAVRRIVRT